METTKTSPRKAEPTVLLLTGTPGVGKTTVIRRAAAKLAGKRLGGFYTEEIRERGVRRGFRLVGFDGGTRVIAHVCFPKALRVGKYGVDLAAVDAGASLLAPDPTVDLYLVDEIGRMECLSDRFVAAMRALTGQGVPVIATVASRGGGFIAEVKRLEACELREVTPANRERLPCEVAGWVRERVGA